MKKILCIANPESSDLVSLTKEFLQTKSIVSNPEVTFISEQDELLIDGEVKKSVEIEKYSLIVVDQTLGWFPEKDASFHGYSLIEMLRRNKIAQPILVASQTSFGNLQDESLGAKVINTPGHYHWDTIDFETNKPVDLHFHLSPEMLDDIIYSVFDIKGAFEESAHTLKHDISAAHQINWTAFKEEIGHLLKYAPDQNQVQDFDL